jgi:hypothetical protein
MTKEKWFSTKLRFAVMVESVGGNTLNDCVFLLRASDFDTAFEKSIKIGEASQAQYQNANGQKVQWRFMEVISLDVIESEDLDGCEVYSEPVHLSELIPFEVEFNPKASKPVQTL